MSWKAGIDALCLGLTKTGAIGCEIIILFGEARSRLRDLQARAKRSGHMPPKMRYLAAQALALLEGDLWLDLAMKANASARDLANRLCKRPGVRLAVPTDGNEVFAELPDGVDAQLRAAGASFYPWPDGSHRFVCAWTTSASELAELDAVLTRH